MVVVGVEPAGVDDPESSPRTLDAAFKVDPPGAAAASTSADLPKRITSAEPEQFVEIVTLREEAYLQISSRIHALAGTRFREEKRDLAPTRAFARALLGSVDPALKEDIDNRRTRYAEGDLVGHGGIQGALRQAAAGYARR